MENTTGIAAVSIKAASKTGIDKVMESGRKAAEKARSTRDSTTKTRKMAMVFTPGQREISTKAITEKIKEMATVRCTGPMAASTKDSGEKDNRKEKDNCSLQTEASREVCLLTIN
jgi:predicted membrane-bound mannosyltransferase